MLSRMRGLWRLSYQALWSKGPDKKGLSGCLKNRLFRLQSVGRKFCINDDRAVKAVETELAASLF